MVSSFIYVRFCVSACVLDPFTMLHFLTSRAQTSHAHPPIRWSGDHNFSRALPLIINTITQKLIKTRILPQSKAGKPHKNT